MRGRESQAVGRQPIEVRRRRLAAVGAERVGAQRIDRDEQDVLIRVARERDAMGAEPEQQNNAEQAARCDGGDRDASTAVDTTAAGLLSAMPLQRSPR